MDNFNKNALTRLLDQRYGDGQIYLTDAKERAVLKAAVNMGLVSKDGYLTHSGRRFWATCGSGNPGDAINSSPRPHREATTLRASCFDLDVFLPLTHSLFL